MSAVGSWRSAVGMRCMIRGARRRSGGFEGLERAPVMVMGRVCRSLSSRRSLCGSTPSGAEVRILLRCWVSWVTATAVCLRMWLLCMIASLPACNMATGILMPCRPFLRIVAARETFVSKGRRVLVRQCCGVWISKSNAILKSIFVVDAVEVSVLPGM